MITGQWNPAELSLMHCRLGDFARGVLDAFDCKLAQLSRNDGDAAWTSLLWHPCFGLPWSSPVITGQWNPAELSLMHRRFGDFAQEVLDAFDSKLGLEQGAETRLDQPRSDLQGALPPAMAAILHFTTCPQSMDPLAALSKLSAPILRKA